jgi:tetratricopeptide (TPR) repeat protein
MITPHSSVKRVKLCSATVLFAGIVLLGSCARISHSWYLNRADAKVRHAGEALAAARSNAERSAAYADRADAYADKARYSRVMKLIAAEEYNRLFDLAVQDYDQAIALAPDNAEIYYRRGNAYYSRASLDMIKEPTSVFLAPAKADFSRAVEKNPKNAMAFDMLGLTDASMGNWTQAIADFEQETGLDRLQRLRLSDAYCNRGTVYLGEKKYDLAISDLNQAIQIGGTGDACECEPYNPLLTIYLKQTREYDKARALAALAQRSGKWIAPENLEQLKASSAGR